MQVVTYSENMLVKSHRGTLPLLLTCPHDGREQPQNIRERLQNKTPQGCDFQTLRDKEVAVITEALAQKILELSGLSPYVVIAQFHRKYIDVNRKEACAFTDLAAQPFYAAFHNQITTYVEEILQQNQGKGFLFDLHGTAADAYDLYIGTLNGQALAVDFDRKSLFLQRGLIGLLGAARHQMNNQSILQYRISPTDERTKELYEGGFILRQYGRKISGIQIEIHHSLREDSEKQTCFIEDLAFAMLNSISRNLPF